MSELFTPTDLRLLQDLALVAAGRADVAAADAIATGLAPLQPGRAGPALAQALARLNAGRADEAAALLAREPPGLDDHEQAVLSSFHALSLHLAGRQAESLRRLQAVAAHPAAGLARAMLGLDEAPRSSA